ncbi:type I restriction enzyme S subunit [Anoxybacillus vitaminiphilus]|uniref:Type I restriction enzyme S subunit n=1 Tax=Paranoxybacillus vitaminiphilus TaxID=581036 RepID=A0A327YBK4_9BACL|nr:restriction endonuclease subunit S [Anoxybacillus vitaminiphilus]RAK17366.1 type I restriction enzyme S subunit [Anoxybacillus vitaminiphilus]
MVCESWKTYRLDEVYEFSSGLSKKREEFGFGYDFLTFKDVFNNYFVPNELSELVNSTDKEREKYSIKKGDVFLTRTSEKQDELGMSSVALKDYPNATFNGFTKRLRPKNNVEILPEYAGFYFRSPQFRSQVNSMSSMTTRASLNNSMLASLKIVLPSIKEQEKIANILLSLHKKIETNNEINTKLEEMAQAIFKHWFVDFEFPNENGEPYKSSGGEMVESEIGMIPKGWKIQGLDEIADFLNGLAMQKFRPQEDEKWLPVLKIRELRQGFTDNNSDKCSENIERKYIVDDGDIIFSWSGSLLVDIWCGGKCGLNQHLFKVTSKNNEKWFYYHWIRIHLERFIRIAESKATTMGHIKRKDLSDAKVLIPSEDIYLKANKIFKPIFEKIVNIKVESKKLREIRDILLPKLMSGEIRVPLES